jgi:hypothetical protein
MQSTLLPAPNLIFVPPGYRHPVPISFTTTRKDKVEVFQPASVKELMAEQGFKIWLSYLAVYISLKIADKFRWNLVNYNKLTN